MLYFLNNQCGRIKKFFGGHAMLNVLISLCAKGYGADKKIDLTIIVFT